MDKIIKILNKKYKDKLSKQTFYKEKLDKMSKLLKEYNLPCNPKDEFAFFQTEVVYESIYNKKSLEDSYLDSYVEMHDFWNDLDYKEKKHQVNVDIARRCSHLKSFYKETTQIYIPMFDERMNTIYAEEIVMLDLKQYRRFIKDFKDIIKENYYGILPYQHDFTSAAYIRGNEQRFFLYQPQMNRIYIIEDYKCIESISFDPERVDMVSMNHLEMLAQLYDERNVAGFVEALEQFNLVNERILKKLKKNI